MIKKTIASKVPRLSQTVKGMAKSLGKSIKESKKDDWGQKADNYHKQLADWKLKNNKK